MTLDGIFWSPRTPEAQGAHTLEGEFVATALVRAPTGLADLQGHIPTDRVHRAARGTQLYLAPRFTIRGPGGVSLWVVIRGRDGADGSRRGPWPVAAGRSIDPMPAPTLPAGKYSVRLEGEMVPATGARRPLDEIAEWELVVTEGLEH